MPLADLMAHLQMGQLHCVTTMTFSPPDRAATLTILFFLPDQFSRSLDFEIPDGFALVGILRR